MKKEKKQTKEMQKVLHQKVGKTLKLTKNTMDLFSKRWKDIIKKKVTKSSEGWKNLIWNTEGISAERLKDEKK